MTAPAIAGMPSLDGTRGQATVLGPELPDGGLEVVERLERLVDAREAEVGDLVELTERRQDRQALSLIHI